MISTQRKIERLHTLKSADLKPHEARFVSSLRGFLPPGQVEALSEKQLSWMESLYERHFGQTEDA